MSILPVASAAQLIPPALVAGKAALGAASSFLGFLRDGVKSATETVSTATENSLAPETGFSALLRDFAAGFQRLLGEHRLETPEGISLRLSEAGDVEVLGSPPQREMIEQLLAGAPRLTELFRQLADQATKQRTEEEFAAFQGRPDASPGEFPLLFARERAPRFQVFVQGQTASTSFGSV